jgi:CheY-like chemotaxis protein
VPEAPAPPAPALAPRPAEAVPAAREAHPQADVGGDRDDLRPGDRLVLIVEHDPRFAGILLDMAHEKGFKGLITSRGEMALELAQAMRPDAITLDLRLPDMAGWVVLDRLKHDPTTRHIPVHVISGDESCRRGTRLGAFAAIRKPVGKQELDEAFDRIKGFVERKVRSLLVVEDNEIERDRIVELVGNGDVQTVAVATAAEALEALRRQAFDCLVLDLVLPDMPGLRLLETIKGDPALIDLPIIVYTGKDVTAEEGAQLRAMAESIITKDARSMGRLLDETALFLHRVEESLPPAARGAVQEASRSDSVLAGRTVLVVDDDVRNLFAMTSMLERWQMAVRHAEDGQRALDMLRGSPDVDVVLMDIMMPGMDGYETIRAVREEPRFRDLPIIALTAKAMKEDRRKCLDAGASDYIAKPVQSDRLRSLLRVWLGRPEALRA